MVMVPVLVLVAWVGGGEGRRGVFRRSKSASHRHYQLQLGPYKQKQSTDKQSIIKPHFTRHAGKAGGLQGIRVLWERGYSPDSKSYRCGAMVLGDMLGCHL